MRVNVLRLFGVFIAFVSPSIFAGTNSNLAYELSNCTKISKNENRLLCFDKLAKNNVVLLTTIKVKKKHVSHIEAARLKKTKQIDDFSKQHIKKTKEERGPDSIVATISKVKQLIRGQWVVYLENGQKWQQADTGKIKLKVGNIIRLKKGSMGAVYLYKEGGHRNIRVKRLK